MIVQSFLFRYNTQYMFIDREVFFCLADILPPFFIQFVFAYEIEEMQYIVLWKMFKLTMCNQRLEKSLEHAITF